MNYLRDGDMGYCIVTKEDIGVTFIIIIGFICYLVYIFNDKKDIKIK